MKKAAGLKQGRRAVQFSTRATLYVQKVKW